VELSVTEFHPYRSRNVKCKGRTLYTLLCKVWLSLCRFQWNPCLFNNFYCKEFLHRNSWKIWQVVYSLILDNKRTDRRKKVFPVYDTLFTSLISPKMTKIFKIVKILNLYSVWQMFNSKYSVLILRRVSEERDFRWVAKGQMIWLRFLEVKGLFRLSSLASPFYSLPTDGKMAQFFRLFMASDIYKMNFVGIRKE
jgi:hypothetical protein